jgi:hypothetical protein
MTGLSVLCIWSDKLSKNTYICPVNRQIKEDGELLSRLVVNGNNYQIWQVQPYFDELAVIKEILKHLRLQSGTMHNMNWMK